MTSPRFLLVPIAITASFMSTSCTRTESPPVYGLQLWSLREEFNKDAQHALDLTKQFGFTEVEAAGTAGMSAADYRAALDARGLKAVGAHVQYEAMLKDIASVVADVKTLGATYAFCPWIPHPGGYTAEINQRAAKHFNEWGAAFRAAGIKFGYHTHGYEFVPGAVAGEMLFDEIVRLTEPENVSFQMDVYWVFHSAVDPIALLKKYPNRWASLHIKDLRIGAEVEPGSSSSPATDKVPVGTGQIKWPELLRTARAQGITHLIVEDESPAPLENIPKSLEYLRGLEF